MCIGGITVPAAHAAHRVVICSIEFPVTQYIALEYDGAKTFPDLGHSGKPLSSAFQMQHECPETVQSLKTNGQ